MDSFLASYTNKPIKMDVELNLSGKNKDLLNFLNQFSTQGKAAGSQFVESFNNSIGKADLSKASNGLKNLRTQLDNTYRSSKSVSQQQMAIAGNNLNAWANKNSKAVKEYGDRIGDLQKRMSDMQQNGASASQFKEWQNDLKVLQSEARATGNIGKTFGDSFKSSFGSVAKFAASYVTLSKVFSEIKQGVSTIVDLDTALVDLQKTSTASASQLNDFYFDANSMAKKYGTTTQQIIQGAANWSRLGWHPSTSPYIAIYK